VQQLGHGLVVGVVLALGRGEEAAQHASQSSDS
jgi:hypothetical protein